jgi:hypothetical protein
VLVFASGLLCIRVDFKASEPSDLARRPGHFLAIAELAQLPGMLPGEIDPARIEAPGDIVKRAFKLATPAAGADVYVPGFVPK